MAPSWRNPKAESCIQEALHYFDNHPEVSVRTVAQEYKIPYTRLQGLRPRRYKKRWPPVSHDEKESCIQQALHDLDEYPELSVAQAAVKYNLVHHHLQERCPPRCRVWPDRLDCIQHKFLQAWIDTLKGWEMPVLDSDIWWAAQKIVNSTVAGGKEHPLSRGWLGRYTDKRPYIKCTKDTVTMWMDPIFAKRFALRWNKFVQDVGRVVIKEDSPARSILDNEYNELVQNIGRMVIEEDTPAGGILEDNEWNGFVQDVGWIGTTDQQYPQYGSPYMNWGSYMNCGDTTFPVIEDTPARGIENNDSIDATYHQYPPPSSAYMNWGPYMNSGGVFLEHAPSFC